MTAAGPILLMPAVALVAGVLGAVACRGHDHPAGTHAPGEDDRRPSLSFTHWTDTTELFIELPSLIRGLGSPCAVHVTRLADSVPLAEGKVEVILRQNEGSEERFVVDRPTVPGIFRPVVRPAREGGARLLVEVRSGATVSIHDLGAVVIFPSVDAAARSVADAARHAGGVSFLKEQQWSIGLSTMVVADQAFRPSLRANGVIRGRPDGDVVVNAPIAGRVTGASAPFPQVGARVTLEQPLAVLAPRLEASDQASLDLAVTSARLALRHAEQERGRLETLRAEGAVPDRRVVDAVRAEAEARAIEVASQQRLAQFQRLQRTRGGRPPGGMPIRSPLGGTIVEVTTSPGTFVEDGTRLFRVVDLTRLLLDVRVPQIDAAKLDNLRGAWAEVDGFSDPVDLPADTLLGRDFRIDPSSQTMSVRFAVGNPGARYPLGASARVHLITGELERAPGVPRGAIVDDDGRAVVYVHTEGELFEPRVVQLGPVDQGLVAVRAGLRAGERVVVRGAWYVKLAASSGSLPAHGHAH